MCVCGVPHAERSIHLTFETRKLLREERNANGGGVAQPKLCGWIASVVSEGNVSRKILNLFLVGARASKITSNPVRQADKTFLPPYFSGRVVQVLGSSGVVRAELSPSRTFVSAKWWHFLIVSHRTQTPRLGLSLSQNQQTGWWDVVSACERR